MDSGDKTYITNSKNQKLFCKYWPQKGADSPRALVFIAHGYAEHCLWYEPIANRLTEKEVFVFSHDHANHGQSDGKRGKVSSYHAYVADIFLHIDQMRSKYPNVPVFIIGHSMGGGLATMAALTRPEVLRGIVLSGPLIVIHPNAIPPILGTLTYYIGKYITWIPGTALDKNTMSRDKDIIKKYEEDPLNYHGVIHSGTGAQMMYMSEEIVKRLPEITVAFLIQHGEKDVVTALDGSKMMVEKAQSEDKTLTVYENCLHQVHSEPDGDGERCVDEMVSWIIARI